MTTYRALNILLICCCLLLASKVQADHNHDEDHYAETSHGKSLDAHVHGIAELKIVLIGNEMQIELHSPAANLLGFEHEAETTNEIANLKKSKAILLDPSSLFTMDGAQCDPQSHEVDFGVHNEHTEPNSEENPTGEPQVASPDHEEDSHSDIEVQYQYLCMQADELSGITSRIAEQFTGVDSLQVEWIVNDRQGSVVLNSDQNQISFK